MEEIRPEEVKSLKEIKLSDFEEIEEDKQEWLVGQEIPEIIWQRIQSTKSELTLLELLDQIRQELLIIYDGKKDEAKSFADSRFVSLPEIIERGMVSCGALANIYGNILRKLNVPTKFVHGRCENQKSVNGRHAWLEIFDPHSRTWIGIDPTQKDFELPPNYQQYKIYHNWDELKEDYEKGEW